MARQQPLSLTFLMLPTQDYSTSSGVSPHPRKYVCVCKWVAQTWPLDGAVSHAGRDLLWPDALSLWTHQRVDDPPLSFFPTLSPSPPSPFFFLPATLRAIGGSGSCMLTVGRSFLATRQTARLVPRRRVTSCFRLALFMPLLLLKISRSFPHLPLITARRKKKPLSFYPFFLNFPPPSSLALGHIHPRRVLFNMSPVFTGRPSVVVRVHVLILSWLSGCWLRAACPYPEEAVEIPL